MEGINMSPRAYLEVAVFALFALLIGICALQHEKIGELRAEQTTLQIANTDLGSKIDASNAALEKIQAEDAMREKSARNALRTAQEANKKLLDTSHKIDAVKASPDDCKAATALFELYLKRNK